MRRQNFDKAMCADVQSLLSDYIDNSLSARQVWEVEKHLAGCPECAEAAHQMQATVQALHTAPRFDTGDNFMAALHARLDGLEPARSRSVLGAFRGWLAGTGESLQRHRLPVFGLGLATAALAVLFITNKPVETPPLPTAPAMTSEVVHISVAASANNPFADPAADNLEFRSPAPETAKASGQF